MYFAVLEEMYNNVLTISFTKIGSNQRSILSVYGTSYTNLMRET